MRFISLFAGIGFRVADGFPAELDIARLKALGNAIVPAVAEFIGRGIMEVERG